jgi:hypothetical protein
MTPKRLLPFLAIFLVLAGAYYFLEWRRVQNAKDEEAAKKIFALKEPDITAITIKRQAEEIRLVKEGKDWRLDEPLKDRADSVTLISLLSTLSELRLTRDLGPQEDVKPFGLEQPPLVVSVAAGDKTHTLSVGKKAPGGQGYYARRDEDPRVLLIAASTKESLDRPLADLRNRTLFDFSVDQVKALRVKAGNTTVVLEKKDNKWTWAGREQTRIYQDRLERLLRFISLARIKDFVADAPKDVSPYGLAPPLAEITLETNKGEHRLLLGARKKDECYARQGDQGPVILMENLLLDLLTVPLESVAGLQKTPLWERVKGAFPSYLEDKRLWTGEVKEVAKLTWGPPDKTWTAVKNGEFYQLTGPDQQERRLPAIRVELALLKLRELEAERLLPPVNPDEQFASSVELWDGAGKILFRLDELGAANGQVKVRFAMGADPRKEALISGAAYNQWQKDLEQLTAAPPADQGGKQTGG